MSGFPFVLNAIFHEIFSFTFEKYSMKRSKRSVELSRTLQNAEPLLSWIYWSFYVIEDDAT